MSQSGRGMQSDGRDVAVALEAIRSAVRRQAGYSSASDVPAADSASTMVTELADLAVISAHLPVTWDTPVLGQAVALIKRATRLALRWYINPIVEQQNAFNEALVRAVASLDERQRDLDHRLNAGDHSE